MIDIPRLNELIAKHPLPHGVKFSYGTAGFRTVGDLLPSVGFRMGILIVLRAVAAQREVRHVHEQRNAQQNVGVIVTASHNPAKDNGLKLVDTHGGMLERSWESLAEAVANAATAAELLTAVQATGLLSDEPQHAKTSGATPLVAVHVARDTRPTGPTIVSAVLEGASVFDASRVRVVTHDHGVLSTPQLHFIVHHSAWNPNRSVNEQLYYDVLASNFVAVKKLTAPSAPIHSVLVDCANGVGAVKLKQLAQVITKASADGKSVVSFTIRDDHTDDHTALNHVCGADFVQKSKKLPQELEQCIKDGGSFDLVVSLDGDADRIVALRPIVSGDAAAPVSAILLDGDRISVLLATALNRLIRDAQLDPSIALDAGVVQTAYANGASTNYIVNTLHMKCFCVATGVKFLHPKAELMDVGIYFEANGHGTVLFSQKFLHVVHAAAHKHEREHHAEAAKAAHLLESFVALLSQSCGDAIGDLLAIISALDVLGWSTGDWAQVYADLPSRMLAAHVPNPTRITTTEDQRRALTPAGLQDRIDALVAGVDGSRAFVRPSGTEPIVRVYAEAPTQSQADDLAAAISSVLSEILT